MLATPDALVKPRNDALHFRPNRKSSWNEIARHTIEGHVSRHQTFRSSWNTHDTSARRSRRNRHVSRRKATARHHLVGDGEERTTTTSHEKAESSQSPTESFPTEQGEVVATNTTRRRLSVRLSVESDDLLDNDNGKKRQSRATSGADDR
jgi:hypothetical protein